MEAAVAGAEAHSQLSPDETRSLLCPLRDQGEDRVELEERY